MSNEGEPEIKAELLGAVATERKIPAFWKAEPELWFCRVEAAFSRANISNSLTKFELIIPCLEFDVLKQIADLVKNPSATPYEDIKRRLIATYAESESRRIRRLLEGQTIGDDKPSHFLRNLKQLAGTNVSDDVIKSLWMRSLPANTQAILIATSHTNLDKLAEVADKIHDLDSSGDVCSVSTSRSSRLEQQVEQLTKQVAALASGFRERSRSNSRQPRQRSSSGRRNTPRNPNWLCFYHYRYKDKANKCVKPCAWETKKDTNSGK